MPIAFGWSPNALAFRCRLIDPWSWEELKRALPLLTRQLQRSEPLAFIVDLEDGRDSFKRNASMKCDIDDLDIAGVFTFGIISKAMKDIRNVVSALQTFFYSIIEWDEVTQFTSFDAAARYAAALYEEETSTCDLDLATTPRHLETPAMPRAS